MSLAPDGARPATAAPIRPPRTTAGLLCIALALLAGCGGGGGTAPGDTVAAAPAAPSPAPAPPPAPAPASAASVVLRAWASGFGSAAAQVRLRNQGMVVASAEIRATTATDHTLVLSAPLAAGTLELEFLNADAAAGRALTVISLRHGTQTLAPTDNGVTFDQGEGPAALDGLDLLPGQPTLTTAGALRFVLPAQRDAVAAATAGIPDATTPGYFIDAERGDDANPGSYERPWRTLTRVAGIRLAAGAGLYLRCGGWWRASLALGADQLAAGSVIAGYGPECATRKATLSGADDFSGGWRAAGGVWTRSLPAGTPKITQLFVDGQALRVAQWPDPTAAGLRRQALAGSGTAATNLTLQAADAAALAGRDLVGATVQLRTQPWLIETRRVAAQRGSALDLDSALQWSVQAGEGFVLQDKRWMLDSAGEFFHDTVTQQLHLIAPTAGVPADLNQALVEGSVRDVALSLSQHGALVVRDLALRGARLDGLRLTNAPRALISRIDARDNGAAGLRLAQWEPLAAGTPGPQVLDSQVAGNGSHGIDAIHVQRAIVQRVMALANGSGVQHVGDVAAAIAVGPGARVEDNLIDAAGYVGVRFSALDGSVVARNTVSGYCRRLSDCGAIYTWTGREAAVAAAPGAMASTVQGNRVLPAQAQTEGAVSDGRDVVAGIYIDDHSHQAQVLDNVIVGAPVGVFVHNASGVRVSGNRIWQPLMTALWASMDQLDSDAMVGNRFVDNQIVPLLQAVPGAGRAPALPHSQAVWFWHALAGEAALAGARNQFAGNRVLQLQGALAVHAMLRGPAGEQALDAVQWLALNAGEPAVESPVRFAALELGLGAELVEDGSFDGGLSAWRVHRQGSSGSFAALAAASAPGCTGACVGFTAGDPGDLLASRPFALRPGTLYVYRVQASAAAPALLAPPYISRETTPWDSMADARGFATATPLRTPGGGAGQVLSYETYFVAGAAGPARVNVQLRSYAAAVQVDNVSVREVTAISAARREDWSALAYARPDADRVVTCADLGWPAGCSALDLDGRAVALPLTLPAGTQQLLLRADSSFRRP